MLWEIASEPEMRGMTTCPYHRRRFEVALVILGLAAACAAPMEVPYGSNTSNGSGGALGTASSGSDGSSVSTSAGGASSVAMSASASTTGSAQSAQSAQSSSSNTVSSTNASASSSSGTSAITSSNTSMGSVSSSSNTSTSVGEAATSVSSGGAGGSTASTDSGATGMGGTSQTMGFRYVRLVAVTSQNGSVFTAIAELEVLDAAGEPLNRSGWTASADSEETIDEVAPASQAIDGDTDTFWHSEWGDYEAPLPHYLQIDLGAAEEIGGFIYTPRQTGGDNGLILDWEFYGSDSMSEPGMLLDSGSFASGTSAQTVEF